MPRRNRRHGQGREPGGRWRLTLDGRWMPLDTELRMPPAPFWTQVRRDRTGLDRKGRR